MPKKTEVIDRLFNLTLALLLLILFLPLFFLLYITVLISSQGPVIFEQKRAGLKKKIFTIYKFRTMIDEAEKLQKKLIRLNEADGPTFKIRDDPRFTKVGKWIANTGLDELPQLINVIKGEMALVGPRPFPVTEAQNIPTKFQGRFMVLPGMTSPWVVKGSHRLKFDQWMNMDLEYIASKSLFQDVKILYITFWRFFYLMVNSFKGWEHHKIH